MNTQHSSNFLFNQKEINQSQQISEVGITFRNRLRQMSPERTGLTLGYLEVRPFALAINSLFFYSALRVSVPFFLVRESKAN